MIKNVHSRYEILFVFTITIFPFGVSFLSCSDKTIYEPWCPSDSNTIIYFSPDLQFININEEFTEEIKIRNPDSLVSIYLEISYDNDIIKVVGVKIRSLSNPLFDDQIISDSTTIVEDGIIKIGLLGKEEDFTGAKNNGVAAKLTLKATKPFNTTSLEFEQIEIYKYPVKNPPIRISNDEISIFNNLLIQN